MNKQDSKLEECRRAECEQYQKQVDTWAAYQQAMNIYTPPQVLSELSNSELAGIRYNVAANINSPTETCIKLTKDKYVGIRRAAVKNIKTPIDVVVLLVSDVCQIQVEIASRPDVPPETLAYLARSKHKKVRQAVAANLNIPVEVLIDLVGRAKDFKIKEAAANNPHCPTAMKMWLDRDGFAGMSLKKFIDAIG